jgi:hypothetical protein
MNGMASISCDDMCVTFVQPVSVDYLCAAPQAHEIVNVALHREYPPGIVFIFSQGRKYLYNV